MVEIDEKKTQVNAKAILDEFHSIRRLAGETYEQRIRPNYSRELRASSENLHPIENMSSRKIIATQISLQIYDALYTLKENQREILWFYHGDELRTKRESLKSYTKKYKISPKIYYQRLLNSHLAFAEAYNSGELVVESEKL